MAHEFQDIMSFVNHLATLEAGIAIAEHKALEKCAQIIEKDAKRQIGVYQGAVGPFQDWAELADSTKEDRARKGYSDNDPLLRSGDLRDSIEHEVGHGEAVIGSKMQIAAWQEFGTATIPPRAFLGPAAFKNRDRIQKILGASVIEGLFGGEKIHEALGYDMDIK